MINNFFFIIGGQRCGTTFLYNQLERHPGVSMARPSFPEPKYFLNKEKDDIDISDYLKRFFDKFNTSNFRLFGEKSTSYYEHEESLKLINYFFPNAKIIFLIRNPTIRAISNYFFSLYNKIENRTLHEVFIEKKKKPQFSNKISVDPFNYLERGFYYKYLKIIFKHIKKENLKIIFFEELLSSNNTFKDLLDFLGLPFMQIDNFDKINSNNKYEIPDDIKFYLDNLYEESIRKLEFMINQKIDCWKN